MLSYYLKAKEPVLSSAVKCLRRRLSFSWGGGGGKWRWCRVFLWVTRPKETWNQQERASIYDVHAEGLESPIKDVHRKGCTDTVLNVEKGGAKVLNPSLWNIPLCCGAREHLEQTQMIGRRRLDSPSSNCTPGPEKQAYEREATYHIKGEIHTNGVVKRRYPISSTIWMHAI